MPSFKFRGFTTGSVVAITVAQGAASVSAQTTWGQALQPNATFSIQLGDANTDNFAPYSAVFRATGFSGFNVTEPPGDTNVYDPTQHRITFIWDFGDAAYVPQHTPNIPTAWRNLNVAYGKQVAHVWHTPGTYTVTCFAFDMAGNWGMASFSVTVGNADTIFPGANTIVWSQNQTIGNTWPGAPAGATQCNTLAQVHTAIRARMSAGQNNLRILLCAGETFTDNFFFRWGDGGGVPSGFPGGTSFDYRGLKGFYFGRFGAGARPIARRSAWIAGGAEGNAFEMFTVHFAADTRQFVFSDIDFRGDWDSTTETGNEMNPGNSRVAQAMCIFTRCSWSGFDNSPCQAEPASRWLIVHDCSMTNWADYGQLASGSRMAFLGCIIEQPPLALNGAGNIGGAAGTWTFGNRHGPMRTNPCYDFILSQCSFLSRNGWPSGDAPSNTRPYTALQPSLRHLSYFTPLVDPNARRHHHIIERCSFEGKLTIGPGQNGDYRVETTCKNLVFDTNIVMGHAQDSFGGNAANSDGEIGTMFFCALTGVTIRNNRFHRAGVPRVIIPQSSGEMQFIFNSNGTLTGVGPVEVYNNTFLVETLGVDLATGYQPIRLPVSGAPPPSLYVIENNIVRVVNSGSPNTTGDFRNAAVLPLSSTAIAGYAPKYPGPRWNFRPVIAPSVTAVREGGAGTVAVGEWVSIPWPNIAGQNNGAAPASAAAFRAAVIANSTQKHVVSLSNFGPKKMSDTAIWPNSKGGVTFDFTGTTNFRVQNNSGTPWSSGDIRVLFDLKDILMAPMSVHANPATIAELRPQAGSAAILANRPALWPWGDFTGQPRLGSRTPPAGTIVTSGTHKAGAIA